MSDGGSKRILLLTTSIGSFLTPFLSSSISFSVPKIGEEFHLDFIQAALIPMIFLIPLASFMTLFGKMSDELGRVRLFRTGFAIIIVSSIAIYFTSNYILLLCLLFCTGVASAFLSTNSTAIVSYYYSGGRRGFALGINAMSIYLGLTFAPFLGGLLIEYSGWNSIFAFSGTLSLVGLLISESSIKMLDKIGKIKISGLINNVLLSLFILSFSLYAVLGDLIGFVKAALIVPGAVLSFILLFWSKIKRDNQNMSPSSFKGNRTFKASNVAAFLNYLSTFSLVFIFSVYLQGILKTPPFMAGLIILPEPILMVILSPVSGSLSDKFGSRYIAFAGMLTISSAYLILFAIDPLKELYILLLLGMIGIGFGLFSAPNTNSVMGSVPVAISAQASGILGTMRYIGQLFSLVIATAVISAFIPHSMAVEIFSGDITKISLVNTSGFISGFRAVMVISSSLSLLGAASSLLKNKGK